MFGAEGVRTPPLFAGSFAVGELDISGQSLCIGLCCIALVIGLRLLFQRSMVGKAPARRGVGPAGRPADGHRQRPTPARSPFCWPAPPVRWPARC